MNVFTMVAIKTVVRSFWLPLFEPTNQYKKSKVLRGFCKNRTLDHTNPQSKKVQCPVVLIHLEPFYIKIPTAQNASDNKRTQLKQDYHHHYISFCSLYVSSYEPLPLMLITYTFVVYVH